VEYIGPGNAASKFTRSAIIGDGAFTPRRRGSSRYRALIIVLAALDNLDKLEIVEHPGLNRSFVPEMLDLPPTSSS